MASGKINPVASGLENGLRERSPEGALAVQLLQGQRDRDAALGADLFRDPVWEMLLSLFAAQDEGRHVTAAALCAGLPAEVETSRRWVKALEKQGLLVRRGDCNDDSRALIYLSGEAARRTRELLRSWL